MRKLVLFSLFALLLVSPGCNNTKSIVVSVASPTGAQALDIGQTFNISVTVSNDKLDKGATFKLTGVGTLTNVTATGATYTATVSGTATVTITSVTDPTKMTTINIVVTAAPGITTGPLAAATEGATYSVSVTGTETGGAGTLTYTVSSGSLPAGLSLSSSGTITGTATGPNGPVTFTIKVTDSSTVAPQSSSVSFSITVNLPAPPAFTTTSPLPPGTEFVTYSQTLAASGYGPFTYAVAAGSNLPAGLSLSTAGVISGQPTGPAGTDPFSLTVTDNSKPAQSTTQAFSMVVNEPTAPTVTTTSPLPNGTTGVLYNLTLGVTGGHAPFTWAFVSGALPPGLASIPSNGQISFTPTTTGVYTFKVQVTDSSNPAQTATSALLSLTITAGPLAVTPQTLPTGAVGEAYPATTIGATGGVPPYTFSVTSAAGTFPPGLTFNSNGSITNSPSPTTASTYNFTVKVTDSASETATGNFSIVINPALNITTASPLPGGTQGASYSYNLAASGGVGSYTWSLASGSNPLPTGLALSPSGVLSGIPTVSGTFTFTVQVADSTGYTQTAGLSLTLTAAPTLTVTTVSSNLPAGTVSTAYPTTQLTATGGIAPYTWLLVTPGTGPLPTGLALGSNGQITGTPTATGTFPFTVQVTDSIGGTAQGNLSITVNAASTSTCDTTLTGKESLLSGDYAFVLSGFDSSQNPAFVGGILTASGAAGANNITGTIDMNLIGGVQPDLSLNSGSTYNLGQDGTGGYRGCMTFVTTAGTQHYAFSVDSVGTVTSGVASDGHMVDFDTTGPFTMGILRQATSSAFSTSAITGTWAFGISGPKPLPPASSGGKFAAAGIFTFSSGTLSGVADVNDNGLTDNSGVTKTPYPTAAAGITLGSGSYSVGSNGRGTLDFTPAGGSAVTNFLYVVSSTEALIMNSDSQSAGNNAFTGRALQQSGSFSTTAFTGPYVIYDSGFVSSAASLGQIGLVSADGTAGTYTYSGYANSGGTIADAASDPTSLSITGTLNVAANGRLTVTVSHGQAPVMYLVNVTLGFYLGGDTAIGSGYVESQTGTSASGLYGLGGIYPEVYGVTDESGDVTFAPSSISGTSDKNAQGTLTPDNPVTGTYSISTGVGLIPSECTLTGSSANCTQLFVVISSKKAVVISVKPTDSAPKISILEQ
jgi:hypothetical protein